MSAIINDGIWSRSYCAHAYGKGARLSVPGVVDLSELAAEAKGVAKVVLESVQDMLRRLALQIAREDYEDRRERQRQGVELAKAAGEGIRGGARIAGPMSASLRCAGLARASRTLRGLLNAVQAKSSGCGR